jgi:hypothetical protein
MVRVVKPDAELQAASGHLLYEVQMFRATALELASDPSPRGHLHDALLESFIVHGRNLLHFLYPELPKPSDVLADDFFTDSIIWPLKRGDLPPALASVRGRANKEVAHLTYDRLAVQPEQKGWAFLDILREVESKLQMFLNTVDTTKLSAGWAPFDRSPGQETHNHRVHPTQDAPSIPTVCSTSGPRVLGE